MSDQTWLLFEIDEGRLIPLQRVKFLNEPYIYGARISKSAVNDTPLQPVQFWFLSEDLAKTEILEYVEN
jgi:hypothetical protein